MAAPYDWDLRVVCFVLDSRFALVGRLFFDLRLRPLDDVLWCLVLLSRAVALCSGLSPSLEAIAKHSLFSALAVYDCDRIVQVK